MNQIITEIIHTLKDSSTLLEAELALETVFQNVTQHLLAAAFKQIDLELLYDYKEKGYEIDSIPDRTLQFTFGTMAFKRHRMRKKGEKSIIPFDKAIGLKARIRNSPLVEMKAAQLASDGTYRKAEEAIDLLTSFSLSHTTIHTLTQKVGETIQEWTETAPLQDETPIKDKKKVPVLFIEGDGLMLTRGRETKRPELHRVQFHEGVEYVGKQKRPVLKESRMFESTVSSQEAFKRASLWLESIYDIRETIVISNSDGGSGYGKDTFHQIIGKCAKHEHFRDAYHVNEKIKQRLYFDKEMEKRMRKAVRLYNQPLVETILTTAESRIDPKDLKAKEYQEELRKLRAYLNRNWESLKPLSMRALPITKGIGVCESNHRPYSYRMKRQGRGFSAKGAGNVAAIISARKNGTFLKSLTDQLPELSTPFEPEFKGALRAALKKRKHRPSIGVKLGKIANYGSSSSPMGKLARLFK
ncbi:ISLre2 family transposase [Alkalibacterium sp. MB6]|uniref:ISLre2 family transposase n=1 Tax=Alkalibacterium sp. MB6 TaxID=2081965 RepID=UPI00137B8281|nr:ISLre2 family transposase [Alkalibacterium sp. MB6]